MLYITFRHAWEMIKEKDEIEGSFPNHISLGSSAVGWLRTEVADWMNQRIHESRGSEYVLKNRT